jgi:hypothetical protein
VLLSAVIVETGDHTEHLCTLVGFGGVICGACQEPFRGTFHIGDPHVCGAVITKIAGFESTVIDELDCAG